MSAIRERTSSVTQESPIRSGTTRGTPANALVSSSRVDESALWREAIDAMLAWLADPNRFEPEDQPQTTVIEAAIDYAMDEIAAGSAAPSSVSPSGGGCIAFEWHAEHEALIMEFLGQGTARFTHFVDDRVEQRGRLVRNPRSRRLEREG